MRLLFLIFSLTFAIACENKGAIESSKKSAQSNSSQVDTAPGQLILNAKGAQKGFVLLPSQGNAQISLLNMSGKVVHSWPVDAMRARLLSDCSLLVVHAGNWGNQQPEWRKLQQTVRRYDWDGKVIWEYNAPSRIHHDINVTPQNTYVFPMKANLDTRNFSHIERLKDIDELRSDNVLEINQDGEVVWEWIAHEQLDLNSCGKMHCGDLHNKVGWTHINTTQVLPENKWYDAGDERFKPGNILLMLRNWWTAFIIDKESKEVVWRYEGTYRGGLSGGHEPHMIEKGLPGAGNIIMFDNGRELHEGESIVLEINPSTNELVWFYEDGKNFFSHSAGSVQRLSSGNTFVSQDADGYRVFEVTPEKEIVWEYDSKYRIARSKKYDVNYCPNLSKLPLS